MFNKYLILLIIGLFMTNNALAQSKKELKKLKEQEELKKQIWGADDSYSKLMDTPEKWVNESAVFLVKAIKYLYDRPRNSIEYTRIERNRVKLLDQAAVTDYSEFSYADNNVYYRRGSRVTNTFLLAIKIVKPDGKEIEIDISKEVITTDEEKKIAIPSLEKGDIIDYYFYANTIVGENDLFQYEPVENVIGATYPIANYEFTLETENDFFVNFNTYNGAPKLKQTTFPTKKDKKRVYKFSMQDVERYKFPRWFYPLVELPSYKFQILFARSGKHEKRAYAFIPKESNTLKTNVKKDEIFDLYVDKFKPVGDLKELRRFLKNKKNATDAEKVEQAFYYIRHAYYTKYIEAIVISEANIMANPFIYFSANSIVFNEDEDFVKFFAAFLKDNKIDYEIVIGTKRYNGDIKDLLLETNIDFILKANTDPPVYIHDFSPFSTANQIAPLLENTAAYTLKVVDRKKITNIETINLPKSTYKENVSFEKVDLSISPDFTQIQLKRNSTFSGQNKNEEQKRLLNFYDYAEEDHEKYETSRVLYKMQDKYRDEYEALVEKLKGEQLERFKERAGNEFDVTLDSYSFEIINNGRFGKSDLLEYNEDFTIADKMIKKAGNNYIVEIGKFIGGQIELTEDQKDRSKNIYMSYPRSFDYEVTLNIPEGYTVSGVDKLSQTVENSTGGFTTDAKVVGNKLIIKTNKHYKNYYEEISKWPEMIEFLDVAFQFTQSKILLKKE